MIVATVIALAFLPLVMLRGRTLVRAWSTQACVWLAAWILWRQQLAVDDPWLAFIGVAVVQLAIFALFGALGANVRWSAGRAALVALIVYAIAIPAMQRHVPDGDEPYYLFVAESIAHDFDLDLANQYAQHGAAPQLGDPIGARGQLYSRHEPFLPLLLAPGFAIAGEAGALATMALFGALLVRSTIRLLDDESIAESVQRAVFPFFAFAPPVLFYATRVWPEVPAALCFVEALRGLRHARAKRWAPALFALVMLKLRFGLVAVGLLLATTLERRGLPRRWRAGGASPAAPTVIAVLILIPMLLLWAISGSPLSVHSWRELIPAPPSAYAKGLLGLLVDGMSGIAFQAPFYLLAIYALTRWREMPPAFRTGALASVLYLVALLPRSEWHGGWAPPLRYIVVFMPWLALGSAAVWQRVSRGVIAIIALWTVGVTIHRLTYPWRLFHITNGENAIGEWLSHAYAADFSRFFPSLLRVNAAAWIALGVLVALLALARVKVPSAIAIAAFALAIAFAFVEARKPARTIDFEDAHVIHAGGALYPEMYTVMRFAYRGGWILQKNDAVLVLARKGPHTLEATTGLGALLDVGGTRVRINASPRYQRIAVNVPRDGRLVIRCLDGAVNLDRMTHD